MTLSEKLLQYHIYKPDKIDETIIVYWNLGFNVLVLLNERVVVLRKSLIDFNWLFLDKIEVVPDEIVQTIYFNDLVNSYLYSCMCSDSELKRLIFHNK